jgi:hypothetical protein
MKKPIVTAFLCCGLVLPAGAAGATLPYRKAVKRADRAAAGQARKVGAVSWEISRGFRFERHKMVFVWFGQLADGRGCGAQLVVRYASHDSRKMVAYFRRMDCS